MSDAAMLPGVTGIQWQGNTGVVQFGNDQSMNVWFYRKSVHNAAKSKTQNVPVYDGVDFIHIQHPGERDYNERPVREDDKHRWPQQWARYSAGQDTKIPEGTPVDILFPQNPEIVALLKHLLVHTVQQLAGLSEEAQSRVGLGGRDWVQKARKYLETSKESEAFNKLQAELAERDSRIEVLTRQVADLAAKIEGLTTPAPIPATDPVTERRGPGRPRKQEEAA